ncbi:DUF2752 domain-containing protein [Streptomyces lushanensis]|uniref:DUF2752 domain-containing protein n=1 Tax=Streptomyces lushanensis TaxID=1434255 RepID=UPI00099F9928|nr:DUF2752 domain-containing protein [Streptomyces lushanensis]
MPTSAHDPSRAPSGVPAPAPRRPPALFVRRSFARRVLPPLGVLAGIASAWTYVALVDPNETGHYPVCPLYRLTGLHCPACGGLRSAYAVAHGDPVTALGSNALAVVGYAVFAAVWTVWVVRAGRGMPVRITLGPVWWWALGALILVFTVIRNLPFGSSLAP